MLYIFSDIKFSEEFISERINAKSAFLNVFFGHFIKSYGDSAPPPFIFFLHFAGKMIYIKWSWIDEWFETLI